MAPLDLTELHRRESEQVEWKENVADVDDVAATLVAFANDLQNLGGGYVVCGAAEEKDEHGFPTIPRPGLTAARLKEVEGKVLEACRDRADPAVTPLASELPAETPDRRILLFTVAATRQAHAFRRRKESGRYYVRLGRSTIEARNGVLRELLVRKGGIEEWDRRPCRSATVDDIDLLDLRDGFQRMGLTQTGSKPEEFLSDTRQFSPFVPPLCVKEPLTGALRPRNFAVLLFGREPLTHVPGAYTFFSVYPGIDRSEPFAARHEIAGTLTSQTRRLMELLDAQVYVEFDKTDLETPNAERYPTRALREAMVNALAHRDYESAQPTRITAFEDRIEFVSPGPLARGIEPDDFRAGRASPVWRNQCLAWFFNRLQWAQAEGQGIPTILRTMREGGCPPPEFQINATRVICVLPAHPRHALARLRRNGSS